MACFTDPLSCLPPPSMFFATPSIPRLALPRPPIEEPEAGAREIPDVDPFDADALARTLGSMGLGIACPSILVGIVLWVQVLVTGGVVPLWTYIVAGAAFAGVVLGLGMLVGAMVCMPYRGADTDVESDDSRDS